MVAGFANEVGFTVVGAPAAVALQNSQVIITLVIDLVGKAHPNDPPITAGFAGAFLLEHVTACGRVRVEDLGVHAQGLDAGPRRCRVWGSRP